MKSARELAELENGEVPKMDRLWPGLGEVRLLDNEEAGMALGRSEEKEGREVEEGRGGESESAPLLEGRRDWAESITCAATELRFPPLLPLEPKGEDEPLPNCCASVCDKPDGWLGERVTGGEEDERKEDAGGVAERELND